jgi:TPR repeat protein
MMALGRIYELGIGGIMKNPVMAYGSYDLAREKGSMHGMWKVAELWEKNQLNFMQEV